MVIRRLCVLIAAGLHCGIVSFALAQGSGGIRGSVYDQDFNSPLGGAEVLIAETGQKTTVSEEGNFVFEQVDPGIYTLVFTREGYARRVRGDVIVTAGQMTELEASLYGEFTDMEEFLVQDVEPGSTTELALLALRVESPALVDSISASLMSQAGASDAASALNFVSGASVADGKYAVIRGLPDRYVNSQINGVRLPTADPDKRAVELDLFPAAAIESMQVSKTFTPDQQGDASGGAVNVILKAIPEETIFKISGGGTYNSQSFRKDDFLKNNTGNLNYFGFDDEERHIQELEHTWDGPVGVETGTSPYDYKWSALAGGKYEIGALKLGGLASFFYDREVTSYENGVNDRYWVTEHGHSLSPQYSQGSPELGDFKTALFDVKRSAEAVKWGGLGVLGAETENHKITLTYLYTRVAESVATLAEDTRGKYYYFPHYHIDDSRDPGNQARDAAPFLRLETLDYSERTAQTLQLRGEHTLPFPEPALGKFFKILRPQIDWTLSHSISDLHQPGKTQFASAWYARRYNAGFPPYIEPFEDPEEFRPYKPGANFTLGNLQRIWKSLSEGSEQYSINFKLPFTQWTGTEGYFKFGFFDDNVDRQYFQESFSNFNDNAARYHAPWEGSWSEHFPFEEHPITEAEIDVDYTGKQDISAYYWMLDLPLTSWLKLIGGVRYETTELSIINAPEEEVTWIPPGASGAVTLNPGDADVQFRDRRPLPSIGFVLTPIKQVTLRGSYSETVARQTFKELTPIQQQEFLGGDVFIGNPGLKMSSVRNYDLRADITPIEGTFVSVSWFEKDLDDPIEYVQRVTTDFDYTTAINFHSGRIKGWELEFRQEMGRLWSPLEGLTIGANGTLIDSEVTLPHGEAHQLAVPNINAHTKKRPMTNAPEHLYNIYMTYDMDKLKLKGTQLNVFYTVRGDTLIAGAGQFNGNYIPDVYAKEYGTLNIGVIQKIGENGSLSFQAKNILNPMIETAYRSDYVHEEKTKTSHQKGIELSLGFNYSISRGKKADDELPERTNPEPSEPAAETAPEATPTPEAEEAPEPEANQGIDATIPPIAEPAEPASPAEEIKEVPYETEEPAEP